MTKLGEVYLIQVDAHGIPTMLESDIHHLKLEFHDNNVSCNDASAWGENQSYAVLVCQKFDLQTKQSTIWIQQIVLEPFGIGNLVQKTFEENNSGFKVDDFLNLIAIDSLQEGKFIGVAKRYINSLPPSGSVNDWFLLYQWSDQTQ